jgi:hypothetical protein
MNRGPDSSVGAFSPEQLVAAGPTSRHLSQKLLVDEKGSLAETFFVDCTSGLPIALG